MTLEESHEIVVLMAAVSPAIKTMPDAVLDEAAVRVRKSGVSAARARDHLVKRAASLKTGDRGPRIGSLISEVVGLEAAERAAAPVSEKMTRVERVYPAIFGLAGETLAGVMKMAEHMADYRWSPDPHAYRGLPVSGLGKEEHALFRAAEGYARDAISRGSPSR